jgi:hypothetical protein
LVAARASGYQGLERKMSNIIEIGGKTYNVREYIKSAGGKWQATTKTWAIDDLSWAKLVESKPNLMRGCMPVGGSIGGEAVARINAAQAADRPMRLRPAGPCRHCGSYCYGDCQAN